jgi:hypothetical protein
MMQLRAMRGFYWILIEKNRNNPAFITLACPLIMNTDIY